ncbi:GEVED domain-containing protein [Aquimarina megaterium]|uniref:GEVED domain-containing protein n=1 Tax=Aquimarina megaterium TaxID=1443666 RepID=UPI0009427EAC|nr:GEVED domain-containing protein [Aquimarina megaterium]
MRKKILISAFLSLSLSGSLSLSAQEDKRTSEAIDAEKIHEMLLRNDNLLEVDKAIKAYNMKYASKENGNTSIPGRIMRLYGFKRSRANINGEYKPVDMNKTMHEYASKKSSKFASKSAASWTEMGPRSSANVTGHWAPGIGRIDVIEVNPNNKNQIFIGAPTGGLWKTTDGGANWQCLTDGISVIGIAGMAIDWNNPNVIYIGIGDKDDNKTNSIGVLKSTDGGNSWNTTGLSFNRSEGTHIRSMVMHPTDSNTIFVGFSHGIQKTTDGGTTWTKVLDSGWHQKIDDIEFKPGNPNIVYAVSYGNNKFYKSTNGGNSFTEKSVGLPTDSRMLLAVTEANSNYVYCMTTKGIYRSTDSGESFSRRGTYPAKGSGTYYMYAFAASQTNAELIHVGEQNSYRSTNGGSSFTKTTEWQYGNNIGYTHPDFHVMKYVGDTFYVGTDGLICTSQDDGDSWTNITEGIGNRQFNKLAVSRTNGNVIALGSQDNGTTVYTDGDWHEWLGADGSDPLIDVNNEKIMYGCEQNAGGLHKSTNGGYNNGNVSVTNPNRNGGAFVTPLTNTSNNTIFLGAGDVYRSTDGMQSWDKLSSFGWAWDNGSGSNNRIGALGVCFNDSNVIYASENYDIDIRVSKNGGSSWTKISNGLPTGLGIKYIAVHPTKANKVAVTLSGYTQGEKVYVSEDYGSSWTNYSSSLPNLPANCAVWDKTKDGLYIGMDSGVFYRDNTMSDFDPYFTGMPNVIVSELDIHKGVGKIRAATYGRGLWEAPLYSGSSGGDSEAPTAPTNLTASNITKTSVSLSWTASTDNIGVSKYDVYQDNSMVTSVTTTTTNITGLTANTAYQFKIKAKDAAGNTSGYSNTVDVKTTNGGGNTYCTATSKNSNDEYIGRIQLRSIDKSSNAGTNGYSDYTSESTNLSKGSSNMITITPKWSSNEYSEGYSVWIDYNQDGDFNDSGEQVWKKDPSKDNPVKGSFTVPNNAKEGNTRMRVSMEYNKVPPACGILAYGEIEDYTVLIKSGTNDDPTCNDGIQNGNETGIDCGGSCSPCTTSENIVYVNNDDITVNSSDTWKFFRIEIGDNSDYGAWFSNDSCRLVTYGKDLVCEGTTSNISLIGEGEGIDGSNNFVSNSNSHTLSSSSYTNWNGKTGFIGFTFEVNKKKHYGWFHISVANDGKSYTILDYAYNKNANEVIHTRSSNSITKNDLNTENANATPNPFFDNFTLNTSKLGKGNISVKVYNVIGQLLINKNFSKNPESITLGNSLLSSEMYFVKITTSIGKDIILQVLKQ